MMSSTFCFCQVAEINRILRRGGIFVGSTFLRVSSSTPAFLRPFRQVLPFGFNPKISCGAIHDRLITFVVSAMMFVFSAEMLHFCLAENHKGL